jgi:hypothetical protein
MLEVGHVIVHGRWEPEAARYLSVGIAVSGAGFLQSGVGNESTPCTVRGPLRRARVTVVSNRKDARSDADLTDVEQGRAHIAALDGVRGLAIILVIVLHARLYRVVLPHVGFVHFDVPAEYKRLALR